MYTKISLNDFEVLVRLPVDFSDENEYPIFIGISGGNQSVETLAGGGSAWRWTDLV